MSEAKYKENDRFGKLTLIKIIKVPSRISRKKWLVRCDCGSENRIFPCNVYSGKSTQCTQCQSKELSLKISHNLIGMRYGRLTVKEKINKKWLCICDCGNSCFRSTSNLNSCKSQGSKSHCKICNNITGKVNIPLLSPIDAAEKRRQDLYRPYIGIKYRWYTILSVSQRDNGKRPKTFFKCKCKCKNIFYMRPCDMDVIHSCGCYHRSIISKIQVNRYMTDEDDLNCYHLFMECNYTASELSKIFNVKFSYIQNVLRKIRKIKNEKKRFIWI